MSGAQEFQQDKAGSDSNQGSKKSKIHINCHLTRTKSNSTQLNPVGTVSNHIVGHEGTQCFQKELTRETAFGENWRLLTDSQTRKSIENYNFPYVTL